MNNPRNHNSIIFLTTLSVYLGLVLVGGVAPTVLAQAATTRNFNVQDEIEVKDDLDKKPDNNSDNFQDIDISRILADFVKELRNLRSNEQYDNKREKTFYARHIRFVRFDYSLNLESTIKPQSNDFDKALEKVLSSLDNKSLQNLADFVQEADKEPLKRISLEIYPTFESGIKLLICFKKDSSQTASILVESLNVDFLLKANRAENSFAKQIYENTKATSENDQVFIVTRLPRGSLDELIKQDAKAENQ